MGKRILNKYNVAKAMGWNRLYVNVYEGHGPYVHYGLIAPTRGQSKQLAATKVRGPLYRVKVLFKAVGEHPNDG